MYAVNRDIKISNTKGVLIFFVVLGHLIEIYKHEYYGLFVFIYAFHMPLFILISGYLAKRMKISKIINLVMLYLIFQTFYNWVLYMTGDYPLQFTYGTPHFHLWYIVSLGFWYGLTLLIVKLHFNDSVKWILFIVLFAISFLSRWFTNDIEQFVQIYYENFSSYTLSFQRTISFMPFFFLGYVLNKQSFTFIYQMIKNRLLLFVTISLTMFITFYYSETAFGIESVFRGSFGIHRYLEEGEGFSVYVTKMTIHYLLAFLLSFLLLNFISNKENLFTKWGDHSLTIFLFHPISVFIIRQTDYMEHWSPDTKIAAFLFLSIVITALLGSSIFVKMTKYICNPYYTVVSATRFMRSNLRNHVN